jgi:hypothetical protein
MTVSTGWVTNGGYNTSPPYGPTGSTATVDVNGTSYAGEWLQIQLPSSTVLSNYQINPGYGGIPSQMAAKWWLLGSRDGISWYLIDSRSGYGGWSGTVFSTFTVSTSQAFTYYRIVVNQAGSGGLVVMGQVVYNGTIEGLNISSDGKVGIGVVNPTRSLEVAGPIINGNPAFSATRTGGNLTAPLTIIFDTVWVNRWNAYSTSTGLFTAPVTGLYFFSFWGMTNSVTALWVQFYKNGSLVNTGGNPYAGQSVQYQPLSATNIIPLVVGDTVSLYLNTGTFYGAGNMHNNFNGYLIG